MDKVKALKIQKVNPWAIPGVESVIKTRGSKDNLALENHEILDLLLFLSIHYRVPYIQLLSRSRQTDLVYVRQLLFYWLRTNFDITLIRLAKAVGGRDHTTVLHGVQTFQDFLDTKQRIPNRVESVYRITNDDYFFISKLLFNAYRNLREDKVRKVNSD